MMFKTETSETML